MLKDCNRCGQVCSLVKDYQCVWCKKAIHDHSQKIRGVHSLLNRAVKKGFIKKPNICEVCDKETYLEGHHPDYKRPFDVLWLCREDHRSVHKYCMTMI